MPSSSSRLRHIHNRITSMVKKYSLDKFNSNCILIFHLVFNEKIGLGINNKIKCQLIPFIHSPAHTLELFSYADSINLLTDVLV